MAMKLYVGGLAYSVTEQELEALFAEHGKVTSTAVIKDRDSGQSKGFGFVEMSSDEEAKLAAEAKVSKDDARKTALAQVPNGTIKESELEKEKGRLIWSFDLTIPDSKDIKEVNVDAMTGEFVGPVETETPEQQAKEKDEDEKKEKD